LGGLAFKPLVEELVGCSIDPAITPDIDTFLIHRDSVVDADAAERYYRAVAALIDSHERTDRYLARIDTGRPRRLTTSELDAHYDAECISAGFQVPERSVSTEWLADRFIDALSAEPGIDLRMHTSVLGVRRRTAPAGPPWIVQTDRDADGPFDVVVNALWEGRLAVDAGLGLPLPDSWSHRFRLSVFVRTSRAVEALRAHAEDVRLAGGWVCACGQGSLADPASTLHRRDRIGISRAGSYFSIDTGKYSIAPWLAREVTATICG
jgi:hypothetical protein